MCLVHSKYLTVGRGWEWGGVGGEQMAWRVRVIFLVIREPQEMSFPQSLGLPFHSISSCFIRRSKGPARDQRSQKSQTKVKSLGLWAEA